MPIALALLMLVPVTVHVAPDVPVNIVNRMMIEAEAIWADGGVGLEWHRAGDDVAGALHVEVGDAAGRPEGTHLPVAWIGVVDARPNDEIYVSRANAVALLDANNQAAKWTDMPVA